MPPFAACLLVTGLAAAGGDAEPDRDRDGLPDFHEQHKHFTDPERRDSDGDGIPDGDWNERREYAYTVRSIVRVCPPVTDDVLQDDYQDARVRRRTKEFVELEVVHYPRNTVVEALAADPAWRSHVAVRADLKPWLAPGLTANWDAAMRDQLVLELKQDGIDVAALDDRALVERVSRWLFDQTKYVDGFTTFCSWFPKGKAAVFPGLEPLAEEGRADKGLSLEEQWQRELFAKGMFEQRVHGSCTSSAIFVNGCMRALGMPTRIVYCIPLVDSSDAEEVGWLGQKLTHHRVRRIVRDAIVPLGTGWSSHTFNEVFVGGRWRRLNYSKLGQDILDPNCFGLMTHVATFNDWADGEMAKTVGTRQAKQDRNDAFGGSNPYSCVELSDQFGVHAKVPNEELPVHERLTITKAYWWSAPERDFDMDLDDPDTAGHLLVHVREVFPEEPASQYQEFYEQVDHGFVLRATGRPDVPLSAQRGWWCDPGGARREFYLRIEPAEFARLDTGVAWRLVPLNRKAGREWAVGDEVAITRPDGP